jgi:ATP-dependent Clp protease ATP-binding subunit ClpX
MLILRKKKPDTSLLIAGIDSHICDKCIEQAHGIVLGEINRKFKISWRSYFKETKRN